jgi:hypothetical protein
LLRRTIAPPPTPPRDDHRLQRGARALLGGGDGGISFSKRSQHVDGQLLQAPVTLGPFTTTLRTHLGCCPPRCLPQCLLAHTCFPIERDPHSLRLFRLAERSSPEMQLEWRTSTDSANPMPHRLEPESPRPPDIEACPQTSSDVQLSLKIWFLHLSVSRWTDTKGGQTHS